MKQLTKLGMLFAGLGLLASCSNDNINDPNVNPSPAPVDGAKVSLNICLSQTNGTKADVTYKEGSAAETNVTDGKVYIFQGTAESNATFYEDAPLDFDKWVNPKDQYLEAVGLAKAEAELKKAYDRSGTTKYFVFVVLNAESYPTISLGDDLEDLMEMRFDSYKTSEGYVMTSAPSYDGGSNIKWLAQLSDSWAKNQTDEESAANVYVQRIAAKVQVLGEPTDKATNYTITLNGWDIDNVNEESFLIQNVNTDWSNYSNNERFFAYPTNSNPEHNRIFWGKDVNYDGKTGLTLNYSTDSGHGAVVPTESSYIQVNSANAKYCHENTFDVESMTKENTTRVVISATAVPTVEGYEAESDGSFFKNVDNKIWTVTSLKKDIATALSTKDVTYTEGRISFIHDLNKGYSGLEIKGATGLGIQIDGTEISDDQYATIAANLKILGDYLDFYYKGECFYDLRIRHFKNGETGLPDTWFIDGETYAKSHVGNNKEGSSPEITGIVAGDNASHYFLGRYGVVRNNWYELTLNSISDIGEPTPPTPGPGTDDDPEDTKLMFTVNILSWAKRQHSYDL